MLEQVALAEAAGLGATITPDALGLLLAKIGSNTRLLVEEVHKLGTYAGEGGAIEESHVEELTPNFAEGDFFEAADAFGRGDLPWTLAALRRHFFAGGDARPVITALQNRNRLLLQLRVLLDTGEVRLGPRGLDKAGFERAAAAYARHFAGAAEKSSFNVFTQNLVVSGQAGGEREIARLAPADRQPAGVHRRVRGTHPRPGRAGRGAAGDGGAMPGVARRSLSPDVSRSTLQPACRLLIIRGPSLQADTSGLLARISCEHRQQM